MPTIFYNYVIFDQDVYAKIFNRTRRLAKFNLYSAVILTYVFGL